MSIRRRHIRIAQIVALLLALANAALAQGGTWRCDTGQLCRGHATGHCCCPPERQPAACDSAAPAACGTKAALGARRLALGKGAGRSCCQTARFSLCRSQAPSAKRQAPTFAAPHCRCLFTLSASPEISVEPTLLLTSPVVAAVPERSTTPLPATSTVASVAMGANPPPSLICLPPQGSRAPPAS
jgi:hypothetical protein